MSRKKPIAEQLGNLGDKRMETDLRKIVAEPEKVAG